MVLDIGLDSVHSFDAAGTADVPELEQMRRTWLKQAVWQGRRDVVR
jgi:hypothetical protein